MDNSKRPASQLFTLRIWYEDLGGNQREVRGKIQDVKSGKIGYFRDWYSLVEALQALLEPVGPVIQEGPSADPQLSKRA
jgi:hypothetical protein